MKLGLIGIVIGLLASNAQAQSVTRLPRVLYGYELGAARQLSPEAAQCFAADIERWRVALEERCADDACRIAAYSERISSLLAIQEPNAGLEEMFEFVATPQLVTIIAPLDGAIGADYSAPPKAQIEGVLLQANTGVSVADDAGEHLIVFGTDLGRQAEHNVLLGLIANEPGQRFLVRGSLAENGYFLPEQCRLVYRMPAPGNSSVGGNVQSSS